MAASVRLPSGTALDTAVVLDPRIRPEELLLIGGMFERSGDRIGAVVAYREVVLAADSRPVADEARRRLRLLAEPASRD